MKFGGQIRNIVVNFRSDRPLAVATEVISEFNAPAVASYIVISH